MKQKTLFTVISVLLFFSMSLSLSAINSFSLLKGFKSGTGTADDPYVITDLSHLEKLSKTVNSGNNCSGLFFSLEADIIMNSVKEKNPWVSIGTFSSNKDCPFSGNFMGNNHTISGLFCDGNTDIQGFFGYVVDANICGLRIDADLNQGAKYSGAVAGFATDCKINDCVVVSGNAEGDICGGVIGKAVRTSIINCRNYAYVSGADDDTCNAGGIVGSLSSGAVTDCINYGNVSGYGYLGGIAGINYGVVSECSNEGSISGNVYVGGICGQNSQDLFECFNLGNVCAASDVVGGVSGYNKNGVRDSFNLAEVSGKNYVGGISGFSNGAVCTSYNVGKVSGESYSGGVSGGINAVCIDSYYLNTCGEKGSGKALSFSEMKKSENYFGFDFNKIWQTVPGFSYPQLINNPYIVEISGEVVLKGDFVYGEKIITELKIEPQNADTDIMWLRDGDVISGAAERTYTICEEDVGKSISAVVSGKGRYTGLLESTSFSVGKADLKGEISVIGRFQPGNILTIDFSRMSPKNAEYEIQWFRNGVAIRGENSNEYYIEQEDADEKISVMVTGRGSCQSSISSKDYDVYEYALVKGDLDGDGKVSIGDAMTVFRFVSGRINIENDMFICADVNKNGSVMIDDAMMVFLYVSGKLNIF